MKNVFNECKSFRRELGKLALRGFQKRMNFDVVRALTNAKSLKKSR